MRKIIKGVTYAFNRNIGWQDRTIRSIMGLLSLAGAVYLYPESLGLSLGFAIFALAQAWTVFSARCILCYFAGACTIRKAERDKLTHKGIAFGG